jgi:hypothetical protein
VLDDDQRVARPPEPVEHVEQRLGVGRCRPADGSSRT